MRLMACVMLTGALLVLHGTCIAGPEAPRNLRFETRVEMESTPYQVRYEFDRGLRAGRTKVAREGQNGVLRKVYLVTTIGGKPAGKALLRTEREAPVDAVVMMAPKGFEGSRGGSFIRAKVLTMEATAYTPSAGRGSRATGRTATGRRAQFGVVAVDPDVIPLGTLLFVEGYGFAIAADTGGAVQGNIIDVCLEDYGTAMQWGRRKVKVHVFRSR